MRKDLPPGFLGVFGLSTVRGKAVLKSVENESITIKLVFCGGFVVVGLEKRARRWARVGVEQCVRFERRSSVSCGGGLESLGDGDLWEWRIWRKRRPGRGWDASERHV